ncbi:hypothetical protein ABBQ32_010680 [Trebouxia sp. C0010 RCD-2024]
MAEWYDHRRGIQRFTAKKPSGKTCNTTDKTVGLDVWGYRNAPQQNFSHPKYGVGLSGLLAHTKRAYTQLGFRPPTRHQLISIYQQCLSMTFAARNKDPAVLQQSCSDSLLHGHGFHPIIPFLLIYYAEWARRNHDGTFPLEMDIDNPEAPDYVDRSYTAVYDMFTASKSRWPWTQASIQ